jgi:hypothetical protein
MGNLIKLDEDRWQAKENIHHIQQLRKEWHDNKGKMKSLPKNNSTILLLLLLLLLLFGLRLFFGLF